MSVHGMHVDVCVNVQVALNRLGWDFLHVCSHEMHVATCSFCQTGVFSRNVACIFMLLVSWLENVLWKLNY